jgi:Flp pilus assembly CpaF family ATPase
MQRRHRLDKTTLLAALLGCVPAGERIVCVEEAPELEPGHPHVVRLTTRKPNVEGAGEVTLRDLVRQALRMRPDRLVVGRGAGRRCASYSRHSTPGTRGRRNAACEFPG